MQTYLDNKVTQETLRAELLDGRNTFYWMHHEGRLAGYSKIILNSPHESIAAQNVTKLERLYLLEEFHGLGQQLFDHNLYIAKQAKQAGIWLYTWKGNHRPFHFTIRPASKSSGKGGSNFRSGIRTRTM